jgi:drug/metabolite transporter (DMT)-like permease
VRADRLAVMLMLGQSAMFTAETAMIHQLGSYAPVVLLACLRGLSGVALALLLARCLGTGVVQTRQLPLQLLRGAISLLYLWVMICSFTYLPFADATAISYTQVAYIAIFSVIVLDEKVSPSRWVATLVCLIGALLIAKPAFASWDYWYLIALLGTSLNGLSFVLNRYLQREDTEATTMFYTNLVPAVAIAPVLAFIEYPPVTPDGLLCLSGLILFGPIGMYLGIAAVRRSSASALGPYTLVRLVLGIIGGAVIFGEIPDLLVGCGVTLILTGCALASCGERAVQAHITRVKAAFSRARPPVFQAGHAGITRGSAS